MRLALLVSALAISCAAPSFAPVLAQVTEGPSKTFQGRDIFGIRTASDPQVRPDGGAIAYVRTAQDIMIDNGRPSIWLVDPASGAQTPLVVDEAANFAPRWSPDGTRLAYVVAGAGKPQLYVRWMAAGRSAKVATLEQSPNEIAWSPDGKTLLFTMLTLEEGKPLGAPLAKPEGAKWAEPIKLIDRVTYRADGAGYLKPGFRHLFAVSADGGQPRQLTLGRYDDGGPVSFMPDGKSVLFSSSRGPNWERDPQESEVYSTSLADGTLTQLTHRVGPDQEPAASPDGTKIAYVGFDDTRHRGYENQRLYVMDRDGKNSRLVTGAFDNSVGGPVWAADSKSLYVRYTEKGVTKVARVGLDGRMETLASGLVPSDLFTGKDLAKVEHMPVVSSFDKKPIDAWIAPPPNFDPSKKYPLILEIHGGPFSAYGPVFSTDVQQYAAAGYVVVYGNPRGSTSYGDAFADEIDRNYPSHDYDDLMSVVDTAIGRGFVDPGHLYVTGGSGGGALTAWIVGKTDRFKAAATQKPVINWTSEVLTTDGYNFMAAYWFGKMPWEDPQGYWARSPLSLVGNVKTPTLVVVGEEDHRTPPSEAEQYYDALELRGVPTALIRVPGASHHGLAERPSQSAAKARAILAWFDKYK